METATPSIALALFALALLALTLVHLREARATRMTLATLVELLSAPPPPPARPAVPTARLEPAPPRESEPEIAADRDSMEALTRVMPNPIKASPPPLPAQIAAGLSRPKSQRAGLHATPPRPPPVKVGPLPLVVPPPRPRTGTLSSMPAPASLTVSHDVQADTKARSPDSVTAAPVRPEG
ncbi:MAG: hypothetical protein ABI193_08340 [Minicystis sp.]